MNEQDDDREILGSPAGGAGLRWRAWPCQECSRELSAFSLLGRRPAADFEIHGESPERIAETQVGLLREWVESCAHRSESHLSLPQIAEGSEHIVFFREADAHVVKVTRPRTFGESYYLQEGLVHQRNCSPLDYLIRLRIWREVFDSAPLELGITTGGQIVSVQKYITGELPTQDAVDEFLLASGFSDVKRPCFLWKKAYPEFDVWLGDARDENFVQTPLGIVPIDVRMWFTNATASK